MHVIGISPPARTSAKKEADEGTLDSPLVDDIARPSTANMNHCYLVRVDFAPMRRMVEMKCSR
jgi:hypothetical protein